MLKAFGVTPVGDERIVARRRSIVTCAGVSAGIDLGAVAGRPDRRRGTAKAIQLSIEYDPQPPFDSGHMSKASATTKAPATAVMVAGPDEARPQLKATTLAAVGPGHPRRPRPRQEARSSVPVA